MSTELEGLRRDQAAGALLQRRMLPASPLQLAGLRIDYQLWPASEMTGDFVDVVTTPDTEVVFLVADVAGHGAAAALVTVVLKSFMCRLAGSDAGATEQSANDPAKLLESLNSELLALKLERHVCALCGVVLPDKQLALAAAGMLPGPILHQKQHASGRIIELPGKALGLFVDAGFESAQFPLEPGDSLTVVTDGIFDLLPAGELKDKEAALVRAAGESSQELFWNALTITPSTGGPDDLTWFCLERVA